MKVKLTRDLLEKAHAVFKAKKKITTGDGLSRTELRLLRSAGIVSSELYNDKGQAFNVWWVEKFGIDEMVGKVGK